MRDRDVRESTTGRTDLIAGAQHHSVSTLTEDHTLFMAHRSHMDAETRPHQTRRRWFNFLRR